MGFQIVWGLHSCTSSYTIKDNDISNNMRTKKTLVNRGTVETTGLSDVDQTGQSSTKKSNKVGEWQTNGNVSERSFSKNQEEMPYIDASMVNINQAVK
ncbi:hypothetical protein BLOT_012260 [Blomia tropicalis]|nr:hypothetical protein BLOT_012260 [Blomia tropicalis]